MSVDLSVDLSIVVPAYNEEHRITPTLARLSAFLASQPRAPVAAIARAAGNIIATRRDRLFALAERLER